MSLKSLVIAGALSMLTLVVASDRAHAEPGASTHEETCVLARFQITQVGSLYVYERAGQGTYRRFAGAQLFLPAQEGLTAQWIATNLAQHKANDKGRSYRCPLDVESSKVEVKAGKTGFWVLISAPDKGSAQEVLDRARRLIS